MPNPQNFTADFADEMKLSKAMVSRLAKQMIKASKIIKTDVDSPKIIRGAKRVGPQFGCES